MIAPVPIAPLFALALPGGLGGGGQRGGGRRERRAAELAKRFELTAEERRAVDVASVRVTVGGRMDGRRRPLQG